MTETAIGVASHPRVDCPVCGAPSGYPCNAPAEGSYLATPHPERVIAGAGRTGQMNESDLRRLVEQTAAAQLEINCALAEMGVDDLLRLKAELEEQRADVEAELRLLEKAIALRQSREVGGPDR